MLVYFLETLEDESDKDYIIWLYNEFERLMYSTAFKYTTIPQIAEDIVQDSVVNLIRKVATIRAMKRQVLAAYIISTVRNTSINRLKEIEYGREHVVEDSDIELESISTEDSLERFIQLSEDLKALSLIWTKLSREDQSLLEGKYILGYNNKELAEMFHCQHSSIRMKLTRARRNAFALLTEQEGKK